MERHNGNNSDGLPIQFFEDGDSKAREAARRARTTWEYIVKYFPLLSGLSHGKKVYDTRDPSDGRSCYGSTGEILAEWTVSVPCVIGDMNHTTACVEIYVHDSDGSFSWRPCIGDMKGDVGTCEPESVLKGLREDGFGDSVIANLGVAHARDCIYGFLGLVDTDGWTAEEVGLGLKDMMGNIGGVEDNEESAGDKFVETAGVPVEASPSEQSDRQSERQSEDQSEDQCTDLCAPDTSTASGKRKKEYAEIVAEADHAVAAEGFAYCAVKVLHRRGWRPGDVFVTLAMSESPEGAAKWCIGSYNSFNNSHAPSFEAGPHFPAMDRHDGDTVGRVMREGIDCSGAEYQERWGYTVRWRIVALRGWKRSGEKTA